MKISFNWLKELVAIKWSVEQTVDKLAELGFPVESVTRVGVQVKNVVSVKILSVAKHPNADRLQIAQVTDGKSEKTIVCGAPNIAPGQVVPCALPGAQLPGGIEITISKIRGVESNGMLCSARELALSDEHAGIYQLPADTPLGKDVATLMGGQDTVLDIEITPNRPDLLSHVGVARELASAGGFALKLPKSKFSASSSGPACDIKIDEPKLCRRYTGKIIQGVKVGPSPDWVTRRLKVCGIRSINNVVDITNYVLLEWGHPLHAFDLSKLKGGKIIVRKAKASEKLKALDEKEYKLSSDDLVIADAENPVAIAGIMGGEYSGVNDSTVDILLESAVFDRATVRQTSRRLALRSESSIRFEKGTDADTAEQAALRAAQLILELAGGKPGRAADKYPVKENARTIQLDYRRLGAVLGSEIPKPRVSTVLKSLNLKPTASAQGWKCTAPSHRGDLVEDVDVIEEVIRLVGYNTIPHSAPKAELGQIAKEFLKKDERSLVEIMRGFGLTETMASSFCSGEQAEQVGVSPDELTALANPLSQEETVFRPSLLPNLLKAVHRNFNHQRDSVALFEMGNVCRGNREEKKLGIVIGGLSSSQTWQTKPKPVDVFYLKGIFEQLGASMNVPIEFKPPSEDSFLHPYQSFELVIQGSVVGMGGMLHPELASKLGLTAPCAVAELLYTVFFDDKAMRSATLPKYPFVERDIAVIVDKQTTWGQLSREARKAAGPLLVGIWPFDIFSGGALQANQKSLAFRVRLQHPEHTLSDAEISLPIEAIKLALQNHCGAHLR